MRFNYSFFLLVLLAVCLNVGNLHAEDEQPGQTQTQARGLLWKGFDVDEVLGNPDYASNKGKRFYLYNVGTGRFVIEGGNWGMEGRLFHDDFGRPLELMSDGFIESRITEETNDYKHAFGCNVPGVSKGSAQWIRDYDKFSFTVLMDVYRKDNNLAPWQFQRVETSGDTYTYYIWEEMKKMPSMPGYQSEGDGYTNYYLGAAYGECHVPESKGGKGDGKLVSLDDDRSCWTTFDVIGSQETYTVNGEQVTLDKLYQWRLISEDEFIEVLNEKIVSINPSVSSLIPDRDFCRNSVVFDESWKMDGDTEGSGRRGYTWGIYHGKTGQNDYYYDEAWYRPLRLKAQFGDPTHNQAAGMKNAKYGFLSFEGIGRTYTTFEVPRQGWYEVQCYGFVMSNSDHDAYLFAKVEGSDITTSYGGESKINLSKVAPHNFPYYKGEIGDYPNKHTEDGFLEVGKVLTNDGERFKSTIWICITKEQFENGQRILQVGIGKDEATQSAIENHNGKDYSYDTDWVCVDDFRATYMGEAPVFFYEDEESLDYLNLSGEPQQHNQAFIDPNEKGHYSGAVCLERSFRKDDKGNYLWNSFSFPLPLTGEQIRDAFGDGAVLAKINSIGGLSLNPYVIDFETVSLKTTNTVVEPGQFYLLKPAANPVKGVDSRGKEAEFYEMGRMFFSINETEDPEVYKFPLLNLNTWTVGSQEISGYQEANSGIASVNYVQTAGFKTFQVDSDGFYTGADDNIFAPNGAYVVSNNTIYHINKDTPLKGFRGWITLENPIPPSSSSTMAVYGQFSDDGTETIISELPLRIQLPSTTAVYDLSGRKVGTIGMNLSKGLYIVNGKKYLVK